MGYTKFVVHITPTKSSSSLLHVARYLPYLLSTALLVLLGWAAWTLIQHPYDGLSWSYADGSVDLVEQGGPAWGQVQVGDRILSINGFPLSQVSRRQVLQHGEQVTLSLARGDEVFSAEIRLVRPSVQALAERLVPLMVALSFWLIGTLLVAFTQLDKLVLLFFLVCQTITGILGFGSFSTIGVLWGSMVFGFLLWWIGPLTIHTHLAFAREDAPPRLQRAVPFLYLLALIFSLVRVAQYQLTASWFSPTFSYLWTGGTLILATGALIRSYRSSSELDNRRTLAILALSALVGFLPFILLSMIPEALFRVVILPYYLTFLALPALPLGYGYAILRYSLIHLERYVNRSAAYALAATLVGALYDFAYLIIPRLIPIQAEGFSPAGFVIILVLIFAAHPLYRRLQRWVDGVFYGGWIDDHQAVRQISRALGQSDGDPQTIALTLCQALQKTMQLEYVNLLLVEGRLYAAPEPHSVGVDENIILDGESVGPTLTTLRAQTGREIGRAPDMIASLAPLETDLRRIVGRKPRLWLLLHGNQGPLALVVLGDRRGGGDFGQRDLEILEVVVRQARSALENARLLEELRQRSEKIQHLHRQVLRAREEERKRVARDLHDQIIQALVGLNYQIAEARAKHGSSAHSEMVELQANLRRILGDVRRVCADLRPPALDNLGLASALQSRVTELQSEMPFAIRFHAQGDDTDELPEAVMLTLYRVFQEALLNVKKHAGASLVEVEMLQAPHEIRLSVQDDGRGCRPPISLGALAQDRHFGLVGLQELVDMVGGTLSLRSAPGEGCRLEASVPLDGTKLTSAA